MATRSTGFYPLNHFVHGRDNNYNFIRFCAATLVVITHSYALSSGDPHAEPAYAAVGMSLGDIAVDIFFLTSGFLVTGSLLSKGAIGEFIRARVMRIYPALIASVIFCIGVVGLHFTTMPFAQFITDPQTIRFFSKNLFLIGGAAFNLPGVFVTNPHPNVVNGCLWSLPQEARLYVILGLLGFCAFRWAKTYSHKWVRSSIPFLAGALLTLHFMNHFHHLTSAAPVRVFAMFFVGAACYCQMGWFRISKWFTGVATLIILACVSQQGWYFVAYTLLLPWVLFGLAYLPAGKVRLFNRVGDYSYGVYVYGFPIQQSVAALMRGIGPGRLFLISYAITLPLAILSWHLLEKRCLRFGGGRHRRQAMGQIPSGLPRGTR